MDKARIRSIVVDQLKRYGLSNDDINDHLTDLGLEPLKNGGKLTTLTREELLRH